MMGDIVYPPEKEFLLHVEAGSASAIESLDIFNGKQLISTMAEPDRGEFILRKRLL